MAAVAAKGCPWLVATASQKTSTTETTSTTTTKLDAAAAGVQLTAALN